MHIKENYQCWFSFFSSSSVIQWDNTTSGRIGYSFHTAVFANNGDVDVDVDVDDDDEDVDDGNVDDDDDGNEGK